MGGMKSAKRSPARLAAVDLYIQKSAPFAQPILRYLRELIHQAAPGVQEEIKWSRPFFVYQGIILCNISAFKQHCSLGLWGAEIAAALRSDGVTSSDAMGTFGRITSVDDLPPRAKLVAYVTYAIRVIDDGKRTNSLERQPRVAKPAAEIHAAFTAALRKTKNAAQNFERLSPSCRREYIQWIAGAKRDETRIKRIATGVALISEGKPLNWKYEKRA